MYTTEVSWHVVSELRKTKGDQQGVLQGMTGGALAWELGWLGDHWEQWQYWDWEDPWDGRYWGTAERSGHWESWE